MSDPLSICEVSTIEIRLFGSGKTVVTRRVTAHRYLDFATHKDPAADDLFRAGWVISHLPTGHSAAHGFKTIEAAVGAMVEIARLRNDWACIEDDDCAEATAKKVEEIVKRCDPRASVSNGRDGRALQLDLNGYAEARP